MFQKISNTTLIGILVVLAGLYFGIDYFTGSSAGKSASLRETLVEIDTAAVSKLVISKNGIQTQLVKENDAWKVLLADQQKVDAVEGKVVSALQTLFQAKPSRMVSKSEKKQKDYQVDSAGVQVQVFEGEEKTLDIVLGRFGTKQLPSNNPQQQFNRNNIQFFSYVRLSGDKEIYACDNFMGASFPTNPADYRDNNLLTLSNTDSVTAIRFNSPTSNFVLNNFGGSWQIDGETTDSTNLATYLDAVRTASSRNFVDDVEISLLGEAVASITFEAKDLAQPIELKAYQHPTYQWILHSSLNPNTLFGDASLKEKLFVDKDKLLGKEVQ